MRTGKGIWDSTAWKVLVTEDGLRSLKNGWKSFVKNTRLDPFGPFQNPLKMTLKRQKIRRKKQKSIDAEILEFGMQASS